MRAGLMGGAAGLVALLVGISGGWAVNSYVLETSFTVIWPSAIGIVTGGIIATLLAGLGFAWGPLAARPAQVLRSRE
jgi:putative ABC transport system permease protein